MTRVDLGPDLVKDLGLGATVVLALAHADVQDPDQRDIDVGRGQGLRESPDPLIEYAYAQSLALLSGGVLARGLALLSFRLGSADDQDQLQEADVALDHGLLSDDLGLHQEPIRHDAPDHASIRRAAIHLLETLTYLATHQPCGVK